MHFWRWRMQCPRSQPSTARESHIVIIRLFTSLWTCSFHPLSSMSDARCSRKCQIQSLWVHAHIFCYTHLDSSSWDIISNYVRDLQYDLWDNPQTCVKFLCKIVQLIWPDEQLNVFKYYLSFMHITYINQLYVIFSSLTKPNLVQKQLFSQPAPLYSWLTNSRSLHLPAHPLSCLPPNLLLLFHLLHHFYLLDTIVIFQLLLL